MNSSSRLARAKAGPSQDQTFDWARLILALAATAALASLPTLLATSNHPAPPKAGQARLP